MSSGELTVVIPTYNRPKYLRRSMYYWSQSPFKIIVADGSDEAYQDEIPANISYFHDPVTFVVDRWKRAVAKVNSPYIVLCADDDMIGFNALVKCMNFLKGNPAYASVSGKYLSFTIRETVETETIYSHIPNGDVSSPDPVVRLKDCMNPFMVLIYAVHRTDNFKLAFSSYQYYGNFNLIELHINIVSSILGGHKILPFFYSAREKIAGSEGSLTEGISTWLTNKSNADKVSEWKEVVSDIYLQRTGSDRKEAHTAIDQSIDSYHVWAADYSKPGFSLKSALWPFVPSWLIRLRHKILDSDKQVSAQPFSVETVFSENTETGRRKNKIYAWDHPETREDWKVIENAILFLKKNQEAND